jgi:malate dehydrogenase
MGGALDSARFKYRLVKLWNVHLLILMAMVIGGHSDKGMVPLISLATRNSVRVSEFFLKKG